MQNLRSVDLNLLVALDAFVEERSVTRAANRLGLSQPAASNMLARLRGLFDDVLLVRTASGMAPTERALELRQALVPILRGIERMFESRLSFAPSTTTRTFNVRMSDVLSALLLPALMPRFLREAPAASLNVVHLSPEETLDSLEADRLDLAVSMGLTHGRSIDSRDIIRDRMVCVMRAGHPAAAGKITVNRFLAARHVRVSISPTDQRFVDNILAQMSLTRDVALQLQHWTLLPAVLKESDLLSVMPESLAQGFGSEYAVRPLPFASSEFVWKVYWHRRHSGNPGIGWLSDLIAACGGNLPEAETVGTGAESAGPSRTKPI